MQWGHGVGCIACHGHRRGHAPPRSPPNRDWRIWNRECGDGETRRRPSRVAERQRVLLLGVAVGGRLGGSLGTGAGPRAEAEVFRRFARARTGYFIDKIRHRIFFMNTVGLPYSTGILTATRALCFGDARWRESLRRPTMTRQQRHRQLMRAAGLRSRRTRRRSRPYGSVRFLAASSMASAWSPPKRSPLGRSGGSSLCTMVLLRTKF